MSLTKITSEGIADGSIVNADLHSSAAIAHSKLANSGVTAGSYGSATAIPALTINAQGLVTAASTNTVNTTTDLGISTATDSVTITSSTGNNAQISEASGSAAGVMSVAHHDKLDGIEASATADQTASEIRTLVGNASDSNVFTDALLSKLNGIEASATADQSASEILTLIKTVDGSGSGLDADLLDGNGSSHYLNYNNLSNRPTIPSNNNQLSNGAGYMSGSSSQLAKAFVNYNGNNNSIRNDYNVSSISDHGNGDQTVNFSSSISMSYTVCGMPIAHDTGGTRCTNAIRGSSSSGPTRMNSTGVRINRGFGSHNAFQDGHTMCVAIFRP